MEINVAIMARITNAAAAVRLLFTACIVKTIIKLLILTLQVTNMKQLHLISEPESSVNMYN